MSPAEQLLSYSQEVCKNQEEIRGKVMESYRDITLDKGRDCNEFFSELEKRYLSVKI